MYFDTRSDFAVQAGFNSQCDPLASVSRVKHFKPLTLTPVLRRLPVCLPNEAGAALMGAELGSLVLFPFVSPVSVPPQGVSGASGLAESGLQGSLLKFLF